MFIGLIRGGKHMAQGPDLACGRVWFSLWNYMIQTVSFRLTLSTSYGTCQPWSCTLHAVPAPDQINYSQHTGHVLCWHGAVLMVNPALCAAYNKSQLQGSLGIWHKGLAWGLCCMQNADWTNAACSMGLVWGIACGLGSDLDQSQHAGHRMQPKPQSTPFVVCSARSSLHATWSINPKARPAYATCHMGWIWHRRLVLIQSAD